MSVKAKALRMLEAAAGRAIPFTDIAPGTDQRATLHLALRQLTNDGFVGMIPGVGFYAVPRQQLDRDAAERAALFPDDPHAYDNARRSLLLDYEEQIRSAAKGGAA